MNLVARRTINAYCECYPEAAGALRAWVKLIEANKSSNFSELRQIFGSADLIAGDRWVFNIKGNHFRLVAAVDFGRQTVFVKWFGRHKEYDKINPLEVKHENPPC
jgi:mRNA interferase HigB